MTTARTIITLALEAMNRLAPGEALDADLSAACLRRLNAIADDWSAGRDMMPQDQTVTATVTGSTITLGVGDFAAITPGDEIIAMQADVVPMAPIPIQQYNAIAVKTTPGRPEVWCADGLSTVYLYPVASGNVLSVVTRKPFTQFADLDTAYTFPAGYQGAFAASLAVAMAPALLGKVTPDLMAAERRAKFNIGGATVRPAIINASPLSRRLAGNVLTGWNR
jgi:hypothetical protein